MISPLQVRHATHPDQVPGFGTAALRRTYLVDDLFTADTITAVLTHHDRIVLAGARPVSGPLTLGTWPELRSEFFLERREAGIVNVGGPGTVTVDGTKFELTTGACLYAGRGAREVVFEGTDAAFYLFSAAAHTDFPTTLVQPGEGNRLELGDQQTANRRTIDQYIHAGRRQELPDRARRDHAARGQHLEHDARAHPRPAYRVLPVLRPAGVGADRAPAG